MAQPLGLTASDIVFSEATPEQRQLSWELCGHSWAAPMSLDDYVEREQHLAEHELNRDGRCRYWVLYLKGYPRQVIASCESTRKPVLISDGPGTPARDGHGYAVTNVYTAPTYRRQGMAAFLLRRLQEQMDADSDCSVLYSDSGRNYYAGLGWMPFPSRQATITVLPAHEPQRPNPSLPKTRPLQMADLPPLCEADTHHLTSTFDSLAAADKKTHVAFLPTYAQISWHQARADFDAAKIFPSSSSSPGPPTTTKGAITRSNRAWTYWSHDWRNKRLRVLRIARIDPEEATPEQNAADVAALLEAAVGEARRCGLGKVVVWNPDEVVRTGCKGLGNALEGEVKVVFEGRVDGGIPSLRWKDGVQVKGVVWEEHFGFCWC